MTTTGSGFDERKRRQEEDYFQRQERRLLEQMRRRTEEERERRGLSDATGLYDETLLEELRVAGFDAGTVKALHLAPLIEVAWAEGRVQNGERMMILDLARERGLDDGPAYAKVVAWLDVRPTAWLFDLSLKFVRATFARLPPDERARRTMEVVADYERVARAAGGAGFVSFGNRVSGEEERILERLFDDLELERAGALAS